MFSGHGLERLRLLVGPRQEIVDFAVEVAVDDLCEHVGEIGLGFDVALFVSATIEPFLRSPKCAAGPSQ